MQRILVIKNIGLWISLNRHFAGRRSIRLSEATSVEMGVRLAQVEKPDLIVCSTSGVGPTAGELDVLFGDSSGQTPSVVCVHDEANAEMLQGKGSISICAPADFLDAVDRTLAHKSEPDTSAHVELLAHYEILTDQPGEPRRGFVNLVQMDPRSLILEGSQPLEIGDILDLTFFLPKSDDGSGSSGRVHVSLSCEIRTCEDPNKLQYKAQVEKVEGESEAAFRSFISTRRTGREGLT